MSLRVLVTGATGFLGAHLLDSLAARGHAARVLARASSDTADLEARGVEVVRASFADASALRAALEGCDATIHAAGGGIARRLEDVYVANVGNTRRLADAAERAGCRRFVFVSSLAAHGPASADRPASEGDHDRPRSHYGQSKRLAEATLADRDLEVTSLRPPALYGPGEHRLVALFRAARRGVVPMVHPEGTVSLLHGADCADACVRAAERERGAGALYLGEPRIYRRREMAELIGAAVGRRVRVLSVPVPALRRLAALSESVANLRGRAAMFGRDKVRDAGAAHQSCDASRAREALGWRTHREFESGARESYADYQRRGWL